MRTEAIYNRLSRIFKTDVRYLTSGGSWLFTSQLASSLSSFLLTIAFANLLTVETYGTYKFIVALGAFIAIPTLAGLNTSLIRAVAQNFYGNIYKSIYLKLLWGSFGFFIGIAIAVYYGINGNIPLASCFFAVAVLVPLMELGSLYGSVLLGQKRFSLNAVYDILLFSFVTSIQVAILFMTGNLVIIVITYFLTWTIGRGALLLIVLKKNKHHLNGEISHESLSLGKHLSVMKIMNTVAANADKIILFQLLGPASTAMYSIALAPIQQLKGSASIIKTLSIPKISETNQLTLSGYFSKLTVLLCGLGLIAIAYIVLAPFFFETLFPKYVDVIFYSQLLAISIISFGSILNGAVLIALNEKRLLYIQTAAVYSVQIILSLIGIWYFGMIGAIVSFVIAQLFYFAFSTINVIDALKK
jgi:O-antigen/teichoic acid export membrane protein